MGVFDQAWNVAGDSAIDSLHRYAVGEITWGILFWIALMKGGGDPETIARWKELVQALEDPRQREELGRIALVFAELAGCYLAWEKALEGWEMTESQVVNRWIAKAETARELKAKRDYLLVLVKERFPRKVPAEFLALINQQESLEVLETWFLAAIRVGSAEEFLAVLRR